MPLPIKGHIVSRCNTGLCRWNGHPRKELLGGEKGYVIFGKGETLASRQGDGQVCWWEGVQHQMVNSDFSILDSWIEYVLEI